MTKELATADRIRREMIRAVDRTRVELERIDILASAMAAFAKPVPDYEPGFQHLRYASATTFEIKGR